MNTIITKYYARFKYFLLVIVLTLLNVYNCFAFANAYHGLTPKIVNDNNLTLLTPSLKYLYNISNTTLDWTTSLPIMSPTSSARAAGARSCANDNIHTYYNSELDPKILELIQQYFTKKSIQCPINNIKIRYTSFDIISDLYKSIQIDKNDKILIIAPTYGYYVVQAAEYSLNSVIVHTNKKNNWKITPEELNTALKEIQPKILLFTNPVNPTGEFYNKKEVENLAAVIKKYNVFVIADEIFSEINFSSTDKPYSLAAVPGMADRIITLGGIGKSRGIRFSFACSSISFISTLPTSGVLMPLQMAAKEALQDSEENEIYLKEAVEKYKKHIEFILAKIDHMNKVINSYYNTINVIYVKPYIIPRSTNIFLLSFFGIKGKLIRNQILNSSLDLAKYLAIHAGVATVPGEAFFIDGNKMVIRIPISVYQEELNSGLSKILDSLVEAK